MSQVVRGFGVLGWRFTRAEGQGDLLLNETLHLFEVHARGPYLDRAGHVAALRKLRDTVGAYLQDKVARRLLLPEDDLELLTYAAKSHPHTATYLLPGEGDAQALADHMLLQVCEPLLRAEGLLVRRVDVRHHLNVQARSELPPEVVDRYLAEAQGVDLPTVLARYSAGGFTNPEEAGSSAGSAGVHPWRTSPSNGPQATPPATQASTA